MAQLQNKDKIYSYEEYLKLPHDKRYELIDGKIYLMSPAPTRLHQQIVGNLFFRLKEYLLNKKCEVYVALFDVRLTHGNEDKNNQIKNVVQPDISVICDPNKLDEKGCIGTPDLIIEVVSPSTASQDYIKKLNLYERFGVLEYWIVQPIDKIVMVYKLQENNHYGRPQNYYKEDIIKVGIFENLEIDLNEVFVE